MARTFGLHRYGPIVRTHGARGLLLWTFIARIGHFGIGLALLLAVHEQTGSFGIAGSAAGLLTAGVAVSRLPLGRLADRRGTRFSLLVSACAFTLLATLLVFAVARSAGTLPLLVLSFLTGVAIPATSAITRALWVEMVPAAEVRVSAYALDAMSSATASTIGPTAAGLLATLATPTLALALIAGTLTVGTIAIARSRAAALRAPMPHRGGGIGRPLLGLMAIALGIGLTAGAAEVAVPAFADAHGRPEATGPVLACWAAGSALGGVWFGTRRWAARHETILAAFLASMAAGCMLLPLAPSLGVLAALLALTGFSLAPATTSMALLIDHRVPHRRLAEASALTLSSMPMGVALGSAACGWVVAAAGARAGLALVPAMSLIALAVGARLARRARGVPAPALA